MMGLAPIFRKLPFSLNDKVGSFNLASFHLLNSWGLETIHLTWVCQSAD